MFKNDNVKKIKMYLEKQKEKRVAVEEHLNNNSSIIITKLLDFQKNFKITSQ